MTVLGMSPLELLSSFVVTWVVGLSPALIARYLIYKEPLPRKAANWIAGISSFSFWLIFLLIIAAAEQQRVGNGAVWVLMFFVSRWVMNRGRNDMLVARLSEVANDPNRTAAEQETAKAQIAKLKK
jgi:hypothetical protein